MTTHELQLLAIGSVFGSYMTFLLWTLAEYRTNWRGESLRARKSGVRP